VGAVFQVRSANPADNVRAYTVEGGKTLSGTWTVGSTYDLSVYAPKVSRATSRAVRLPA
jgi:phospholipase C